MKGKLRNHRYYIYRYCRKICSIMLHFVRNNFFFFILLMICISVTMNKRLRKSASRKSIRKKNLLNLKTYSLNINLIHYTLQWPTQWRGTPETDCKADQLSTLALFDIFQKKNIFTFFKCFTKNFSSYKLPII